MDKVPPQLRRGALLGALGLALCGSCGSGDAPPPAPEALAARYVPPAGLEALEDGQRAFPLEFEVRAEAWEALPTPGLYRARAPWARSILPILLNAPARLVGEGMAFRHHPVRRAVDLTQPGAFALLREVAGDELYLCLAPGVQPPAQARLRVLASAGAAGDAGWRLAAGPLAGDGFLLRPGDPLTFTGLDLSAGGRLAGEALCIGLAAEGSCTLTLALGGKPIASQELTPRPTYVPQALDLTLPADLELSETGPDLTLSLEGPAPWVGLFEPRLVPADAGPAPKPDIVVFLADTFRADNLTFYGGQADVTPNLDRFAEDCLRVRQAWSPACWTLPSHASLFLGVFPFQHTAVRQDRTPGQGLVSIAQRLREAGYRTAAVTDGLFVSRKFELDRGFERFEEYQHRDLDRTLERARTLLAEEDGRPLFLFVQTYRTHEPYTASQEARARLEDRFAMDRSWDELKETVLQAALAQVEAGDTAAMEAYTAGDFEGMLELVGLGAESTPAGRDMLERLRGLYLGGVYDLDRAFGGFLRDLDGRPRSDRTWLVFLSDHGEAFYEHGNLFHGHGIWEENLRIPLLIRGPGLRPRTLEHPATLVDLPQTLAEMAETAPDRGWLGTSLLSLDRERPVFAFDCAQNRDGFGVLLDRGLKVAFPADPEEVEARTVSHAYDLRADAGERSDLAGQPRPRTALDALADDVLELLKPRAAGGTADLDASDWRAMQDLGYAGSGD